jgi:hypothetical protein
MPRSATKGAFVPGWQFAMEQRFSMPNSNISPIMVADYINSCPNSYRR